MNKLEEKCALLSRTSQARWFDLRYKPMVQLLLNMNEEGFISLKQMSFPVLQMMNIHTYAFKYDGEIYFLFVNQVGNTTECFHLERTNSNFDHMLSSHLILSSDDDPNEKMWLPLFAVTLGYKTNSELISKVKSML